MKIGFNEVGLVGLVKPRQNMNTDFQLHKLG